MVIRLDCRKRAGRTHVAFGDSAGCATRMLKMAQSNFAARTQRLAIRHWLPWMVGSGTDGAWIPFPAQDKRGNYCVCSVWRLVGFAPKVETVGNGGFLIDVYENRCHLESGLASCAGLGSEDVDFQWF